MGWKCLKQVLIMMMIILLTGCGSSREPIKSAVSSALIGVQNYDERTVEKYFGVNILDPNTFLDAKITNDIPFDRMMPQVVERFNFRILDVYFKLYRLVVFIQGHLHFHNGLGYIFILLLY